MYCHLVKYHVISNGGGGGGEEGGGGEGRGGGRGNRSQVCTNDES